MEKRNVKGLMLHALARQLQRWADFVARQAGAERRGALWGQGSAQRVDSRFVSSPMPVAQSPIPEEYVGSGDIDSPPAHWLARAQLGAPELLWQKGHASWSTAIPSQVPLTAQEQSGTRTMIDGQEMHVPAALGMEKDTSRSAEPGKQPDEARRERQVNMETSVSGEESPRVPSAKQTSHDARPFTDWHTFSTGNSGGGALIGVEERRPARAEKTEPAEPAGETLPQAGVGHSHQVSLGALHVLNTQVVSDHLQDSEKNEHNHWSQASIPGPAYGNQSLIELEQASMRWPSLPLEETTRNLSTDWDIARRAWEREQRLDEEQRGRSWNA
ncbi:hypothetical protein KSC_016060 [Ktedonobacter sp. SOSP1-52]|uniref:hypothetical protein n=1 Tax=Ktedonobacter sp. SOSP1-52 TaxID=2778366 RepID=UPI0019154EFE|nr:hypothetical protein [Ktedonobacter sp. SOSP1-52]GHO62714.1 hypothetical protein KSC_016060 [Ktedonobacter sp. SOSP1-52]